jgi:hypothetical protein
MVLELVENAAIHQPAAHHDPQDVRLGRGQGGAVDHQNSPGEAISFQDSPQMRGRVVFGKTDVGVDAQRN